MHILNYICVGILIAVNMLIKKFLFFFFYKELFKNKQQYFQAEDTSALLDRKRS